MNIDKKTHRLPSGKFFAQAFPKDLIVLHFTAGSTASGAVASWKSQSIEIGTPYVLDKDGTVFEVFDPKFWAYHLAITGPKARQHAHDKRSVPIEVVNWGPLKLKGDTLYAWPGNYSQRVCTLAETDKYVKADYRGFQYYDAFTPAQKTALVALVKFISTEFKIPIVLPPLDKREKFDVDFFDTWKGVCSHENWRPDKFDIGPAWDWSLLA